MLAEFDLIEIQRLTQESMSPAKLFEMHEWVSRLYDRRQINFAQYIEATDSIRARIKELEALRREINR